jgi:O-methyltransferase
VGYGLELAVIQPGGETEQFGSDTAGFMRAWEAAERDHVDIVAPPPIDVILNNILVGNHDMEQLDGRDYVRWAYRLLLGREPEDSDVIEHNPFRNDRVGLLQAVLRGPEFLQIHGNAFAIPPAIFLNHEGRLKQTRELIKGRGDPIRDMTVALALETIDREEIEGDMAELGVYRGEMAILYHRILPNKELYLFDTFTGFPTKDLEVFEDDRFSDTSIEYVKSRIGNGKNVIFKPGYFPETVSGMEECRFCFVMLDADLYKPTRAGLEFFYPRMSRGGYIFLHDYTSNESNQGVSRAAAEFLADKPEKVIEIPDTWGTALFRKL